MAAVNEVEFTQDSNKKTDRVKVFMWTLSTADPQGDALVLPSHADKTIQVYGTFGSGTVDIQGANHPTSPTWSNLTDQSDNFLAFTSAKIEVIIQNPYQIRPVISGSTGATVTVVAVLHL
jgi:hypothetical protein